MAYEIDKKILDETKCKHTFKCLETGKCPTCESFETMGKELLVKCDKNTCEYAIDIGYSNIQKCGCPTRIELHKKYGI